MWAAVVHEVAAVEAVLEAVLADPLLGVSPALGGDTGDPVHLAQVDRDALTDVGGPRRPHPVT